MNVFFPSSYSLYFFKFLQFNMQYVYNKEKITVIRKLWENSLSHLHRSTSGIHHEHDTFPAQVPVGLETGSLTVLKNNLKPT